MLDRSRESELAMRVGFPALIFVSDNKILGSWVRRGGCALRYPLREPGSAPAGPQTGSQRPWWRRIFRS